MSAKDEALKAFIETVDANPQFKRLFDAIERGEPVAGTLDVSGPVQESLQAVTSLLMTYCDGLLEMNIRLAGAIDDLRDNGGVETNR